MTRTFTLPEAQALIPVVNALLKRAQAAAGEARESIGEIDEIGVHVKDLDTGLLEFPFQLEDQIVLLCWIQGETAIQAWRTLDQSYDERQPLDDRFTRGERPH